MEIAANASAKPCTVVIMQIASPGFCGLDSEGSKRENGVGGTRWVEGTIGEGVRAIEWVLCGWGVVYNLKCTFIQRQGDGSFVFSRPFILVRLPSFHDTSSTTHSILSLFTFHLSPRPLPQFFSLPCAPALPTL